MSTDVVHFTPKGVLDQNGELLDLSTLDDAAYTLRALEAQRQRISEVIDDLKLAIGEHMDAQGQRNLTISNDRYSVSVEVGAPNPTRLKGWHEETLRELLVTDPPLPELTYDELVSEERVIKVNLVVANRLSRTHPESWGRIIQAAREDVPSRRKVVAS